MANTLVKFRWAIFWRILPVAVVPIILVGLLTRFYIESNTATTVQEDNQTAAAMLAASVDAYLRAPAALIQQTADFLNADQTGRTDRAAYLQSIIANSNALEAVLILNEYGVVQQVAMRPDLTYRIPDLLNSDLSRQAAFGVARATTRPTLSPVNRSPWTGQRSVSICYRSGKLVVLGVLSTEALQEAIRVTDHDGHHYVQILDQSGTACFHSGGFSAPLALELARNNVARSALRGAAGTVPVQVEGKAYITSAAPVTSSGWVVQVSVPASLAYAPVRNIDLLFAVLTAGSFALVAATAMLLAGGLARPLQSLGEATALVAAGSYELPLPAQQYREIEELAHSFREMASAIRRREDKLLSTQKTLNFAARGTAQGTGQAFFTDLVNVLASTTGARCLLVTEWISGSKPRARVLAARTSVPLENDFTYELSGNPCARLRDKTILHIVAGASNQYSESPVMRLLGAEGYIGVPLVLGNGNVGGHIAIVDDHELLLEEQMRSLLLVLAARGGAELDRIQTDRRLKESELLYRTIVQDQTELICRSTIDGTLSFVNDAYCRYFDKRREDLVGRSFISRIHENDRDLVRSYFARLAPDLPCETVEYRVYSPTGDIRWQQWTNRAILDSKGRIVEYQGTGRDITERRKVELALTESEQRFRQLAESINSVFWLCDWATQKVLYVSAAFPAVWGMPESALVENPLAWTISIVEEDRARVVRDFLLHAAEGQYTAEYRITRPDGQTRWIRDRRFPIRNDEGQVYRIAGLAEDITEQKAAHQALHEAKVAAEQANQAKDQFLTSLSHELRTPLTPVLLAVTSLEAMSEFPPTVREHLSLIRSNVQAQARLIDNLLDLTRIAAGKLTLYRRPTDAHGLIRAAILGCEGDLQSKPIRINVELKAEDCWINADPERIQQVIENLLRNAVKFTPAGGEITIRSWNVKTPSSLHPQLVCEISDTGIGMDPATRQKLFETFQQTRGLPSGANGLGLGLALSQAIVALHGGAIRGESEGLGKGSQFALTLQTTAPIAEIAEDRPVPTPRSIDHLQLLFVEDHIPTARVIQRLFRELGYSVTWAPDVATALKAIEEQSFDLLLSDVGLPDGTGLDLIGPFRKRFGRPGIALSGFGTEQDIRAALDAGFAAHLVKPVDIERLKATVNMVAMQQPATQLPVEEPSPAKP